MKQSIKLERPELANLFSSQGFMLYLRDGQDITLLADRSDMPEDGKLVPVPLTETSLPPPAVDPPAPKVKARQGRQGRATKKRGRPPKAKYICSDCGASFNKKQALGGHRTLHRYISTRHRRALNPRSRDSNQQRQLTHWCRRCNLGFPTQQGLERHQQKKHGLRITRPVAEGVSA